MSSAAPGGRWIVVADSLFVPARVGGHREHAGFVDAAVAAGLVAALVVPLRPEEVPDAHYRAGDVEVPVIGVPRDLRRRRLVSPRHPFVVASRPAPEWLVPTVAAAAPDATAVIAFSYKVHRLGRRLAEGLGVPAVLRQHNLEAHYHRELARGTPGPRGWLLRWEAARIEHDERRLEHARWLHAIADISLTDAAVRRARATVPVHHVGPFALGTAPEVRRAPRAAEVLFLGSLDVATNHDGLRWFVDRVWPRVRARAPGSRLVVVGSNPPGHLLRHLADAAAVTVHADVPQTAPYLASATVAVNPTVSGSGVNIKLVEYLVSGVPAVTTGSAAAGLGLRPGIDVAVADGPAEFADAVVAVLTDPDAQRAAADRGARARATFAAHAGLARIQELLARPVRSTAGTSRSS